MAALTNRYMQELLGGDPEFFEPNAEPVPESLVGKLAEGFKEVDGCVVPRSFQATSIWSETRPRTDNVDDETGFECALSKVYLEDFVDKTVSLSELARIGCGYAMYLRKMLLESQVSGTFRIIVDAQRPDATPGVGNACSVRFHKVRPGQAWLTDDLELYKENWGFGIRVRKGSGSNSVGERRKPYGHLPGEYSERVQAALRGFAMRLEEKSRFNPS